MEVLGELIWSSILICVLISFSLIKYMKRACCKCFVVLLPQSFKMREMNFEFDDLVQEEEGGCAGRSKLDFLLMGIVPFLLDFFS